MPTCQDITRPLSHLQMKCSRQMIFTLIASRLLIAAADSTFEWTAADEEHPGNALSKIVKLIDNLKEKVISETKREEDMYTKYLAWYDATTATSDMELKYQQELVEKYNAELVKTTATIKDAQAEIDESAKDLTMAQTQLSSATKMREKEAADHAADVKELNESLRALATAIGILSTETKKDYSAVQKVNTRTLNSLLQTIDTMMDAAAFSSDSKDKLMALIQSSQKDSEDNELANKFESQQSNLDKPAYESKSGEIFNLLADMKEKAEKKLNDMLEDERKAQSEFALLKVDLEAQVAAEQKVIDRQKAVKGAALQKHAEAEKAYNTAKADVEHILALQAKNKKDYASSVKDHEESKASQAGELQALDTAKAELSKAIGSVGGDGDFEFQQVPATQDSSVSLLQVVSEGHTNSAKARALDIVKKLARSHHSPELAQLASRMKTLLKYNLGGRDPFAKVKKLIKDMIEGLSDSLAQHKGQKEFCDEQLPKTKTQLEEKGVDVQRLDRLREMSYSKEFEIKDIIKVTTDGMKKDEEEYNAYTAMYEKNKRNYAFTKDELTEALAGVTQAISVLEKFYGKPTPDEEKEAAALLQQAGHAQNTNDASADGNAPKTTHGHGIISILEVVKDDIAKSLELAISDFENMRANYDAIMQEYLKSRTKGLLDIEYYNKVYVDTTKATAEYKADEDSALSQKNQLSVYYLQLMDRCTATRTTYADKKKKRDEEIAGLKDALAILEDETALLQKEDDHRHRRAQSSLRGLHFHRD